MNRSLKLSMLLALALGSTQAAALEMGQIQVKSALGQPLLAEIPLTPDSPAELRNISARLASPEDFARAGLSGVRPDLPLQFSIADVGGRKVIRITSAVAVNDPYLDLLVELDSAAGRSLREFPVLLDPPGSAPMTPSVRAPRSHAAPVRPAGAVSPAAAGTAAAPTAAAANPAAAAGQIGPVERGQTLSGIARRVAPAGVDPGQMMLALKQANPDAFYQDNINALKRGAVLRVPSSQEAQAQSVAAALAEIRRQNSDWRAEAARSTATVADAAARDSGTASGAPAAADRLALVPPKAGGKSAGVQGGSGKSDAALRQDLLRSQESLTTLQQQSAELKSRLKDLQDINDKNTRLLALKDNEIAELQQKLAQARKTAGMPAAAATAAVPAAATSAAVAPSSASAPTIASAVPAHPGSTAGAAAPAAARSTVAVAPPLAKPGKPVAKPAAKSTAATPAAEAWYMQPWVWAAAAGAVVLLLLLALLGRRRAAAADRPTANGPSSLADRFGALPPTPSASADPDQDELLDQLAEHPDDIGLHLELVSLYYSRRDVEHFEAAAEAMHAHIVSPEQDEWQDVLAMGHDLVPGHPLFGGSIPAGHAEAEMHEHSPEYLDETPHAFDLDSHASHDELDELAPSETAPARPKVSEYHFDFNLTPPPTRPAAMPSSELADAEHEFADHAEEHADAPPHPFDALPTEVMETPTASSWHFDEPLHETTEAGEVGAAGSYEPAAFSDDPIDTKLDLARAYMDMGDADGARAMLEEVMSEGSQMQRDAAQRLIDSLA